MSQCSNSAQCIKCGTTGGHFVISEWTASQNPATPGTLVTINLIIRQNCYICIERMFVTVCLHDSNGMCVADTGEIDFSSSLLGFTKTAQLSYIQPLDRNFNGTLSLVQQGFLSSKTCVDSKQISIDTIIPPTQKYSCNPNTKKCDLDSNNGIGLFDCKAQCGNGGGGTTCDSTQMPILGICLPKQVVFVGLAILAYSVLSKR